MNPLPQYHAARWDEPVIFDMGRPGARGQLFPALEPEIEPAVIPTFLARNDRPALPEVSEFEVQRHFLHLSQMTLGMMGISLFGTCTMKYNSKTAEYATLRPELAEVHPCQHPDTLQGVLQIIHDFDHILRALSGMDQFIFQAGGGADAAYTMTAVARAWWADRGELGTRTEMVTSVQSHPCNPATAAAAGFDVVNLPLEANGYPSLDALRAAVGPKTALVMLNNPDDMGIYNPEIREWVAVAKAAGALAFYDHANFNGVMGKICARELGFDACMFMLHKTFGAPKAGGGPAVGAYGCTDALAPYLPAPLVVHDGQKYTLDHDRPKSCGKVREFWGNVPQVVKAYAWARAMGADGINLASDISVVANNYMDMRLGRIDGIAISNPAVTARRMEMTRWSLEPLFNETGIGTNDFANRMADYGIDPWWMSHHPWIVAEPFTPEAGELWSKQDIDRWIDVVAQIVREARETPDLVRTAPHNQAVAQVHAADFEDPALWAMTWRAYLRKHHPGAARRTA